MDQQPQSFSYESMGTQWKISIFDHIDPKKFSWIETAIKEQSIAFDQTYSRFIKTSLVWQLAAKKGLIAVPQDFVKMLRLYEKLFDISEGKFTPLIGVTLNDLGYDEHYSLVPKKSIRHAPDLHETLRIVDDEHIELRESALFDIGALGKGFFVDKIAAFLRENDRRKFIVDGSGDLFCQSDDKPLRIGLEHPHDRSKVIGTIDLQRGAICGSGSYRRAWRGNHHIIDPATFASPSHILATWVTADTAALADGLATCIFLTEPERYAQFFPFEYCILNNEYKVKRSPGFRAELF